MFVAYDNVTKSWEGTWKEAIHMHVLAFYSYTSRIEL